MSDSLFPPPFDTRALPPHDAAPVAFTLHPGPQRQLAIAWARDAAMHPTDHSDQDLMRAARVLIANSNADFQLGSELLKALRAKA